jgi:ATP-dependent Clp protease ATP-binding subunit ClpC
MELTCKQPWIGLADLPRILEERIIGQRFAVARISRAVQAAELGLNDTGVRPKGSFLLLGPTGVGKTESAKCFTEALFGSKETLEMIFMNEYSSSV